MWRCGLMVLLGTALFSLWSVSFAFNETLRICGTGQTYGEDVDPEMWIDFDNASGTTTGYTQRITPLPAGHDCVDFPTFGIPKGETLVGRINRGVAFEPDQNLDGARFTLNDSTLDNATITLYLTGSIKIYGGVSNSPAGGYFTVSKAS